MTRSGQRYLIYLLCALAFAAHAALSLQYQSVKSQWENVPPVPESRSAAMFALGDKQFAYRAIGIMIQNMGDTGGDVTPLYKYDFDRLAKWFFLEDSLDEQSNFIPMLAAYYYGGTQNPDQLDPVIDYLTHVGERPYEQKWRWLAHAVYLARFRQEDMEQAAMLANRLAGMWHPGMPGWALQMPAFVANQQGDKQAAYDILVTILKNERDNMHPAEVNFTVDYICTRLLTETEAASDPLCNPPE